MGKDKLQKLREENARLRAIIANADISCLYCSLPNAEMSLCALGFPGCSRADDLMVGSNLNPPVPIRVLAS